MGDETPSVEALADRFWEGFLERNPTYATFLGDERYDDRLEDPGPEGRQREVEAYRELLESARRVDRAELGIEDTITLDMLEVVAAIGLREHEHRFYQLGAVNHMYGPQVTPGELARVQRTDTPERFERLLSRLAAFPAYIDAYIGNMEDGVAQGRTAAPSVVDRTVEQVERMVATPVEDSPLLTGLSGLDEDQRTRLGEVLERDVLSAQARLLDALRRYRPHARGGDGLWSLSDGEELYRTAIVASTTLEQSPDDLHRYGLEELERIDAERERIAHELGFGDAAAFRAALDVDPTNQARTREELVETARRQVDKATALAPRYFGRLPRAACDVRAVEPFQEREAPPAFYYPPAADGSRPGIYFINTYQPEQRPLHRLAGTTYHEAVPGHHFQLAIETELEGLHAFRRLGSRLVGVAFPEGWGLYSERLADEMGLYEDARERFGMLDGQAWRAARLVVDTGLHAFRWERARSIAFLEQVGLGSLEAETETDRYIAWPGQALAYMTGQRELQTLRRELEQRDGERFDLTAFHDALLGHGSLPLATLRRELPNWLRPAEA